MSATAVTVIFGNASHASKYARAKAVNPRNVVLATHPDFLQGMMTEEVRTLNVVRLPQDMWKPTTFPCEKRVADTEKMIKGYRRLGMTVSEMEW